MSRDRTHSLNLFGYTLDANRKAVPRDILGKKGYFGGRDPKINMTPTPGAFLSQFFPIHKPRASVAVGFGVRVFRTMALPTAQTPSVNDYFNASA